MSGPFVTVGQLVRWWPLGRRWCWVPGYTGRCVCSVVAPGRGVPFPALSLRRPPRALAQRSVVRSPRWFTPGSVAPVAGPGRRPRCCARSVSLGFIGQQLLPAVGRAGHRRLVRAACLASPGCSGAPCLWQRAPGVADSDIGRRGKMAPWPLAQKVHAQQLWLAVGCVACRPVRAACLAFPACSAHRADLTFGTRRAWPLGSVPTPSRVPSEPRPAKGATAGGRVDALGRLGRSRRRPEFRVNPSQRRGQPPRRCTLVAWVGPDAVPSSV